MSSAQYGHGGQHHGIGTPECPRDLHHHHDERCVSPLDERRQRAREAAYDDLDSPVGELGGALEAAIETATRIKIDESIEQAAEAEAGDTIHDYDRDEMRRVLIAAFRAAGFEVEP